MDENKRIVEIGGVKLEVDLRHAKVIENFKIGDTVKVLIKDYSSWKSHPGTIIGFDNFKERPTVVIAYVEADHNGAELKLLYFNKDTEETEICMMSEAEKVIDRQEVVEKFDRNINQKIAEVEDLRNKKQYFLNKFGMYFEAEKAIEKVLAE